MTKPTEGPYRAEGTNIYGGDGWTIGITTGLARQAAANARLLAASWEMRKRLEAFAVFLRNHAHELPPEVRPLAKEYSAAARALLARIDGETE